MSLITFLQKRRYTKHVSFWPYAERIPLYVRVSFSVNSLAFGSRIDDCRPFGKPDGINCISKTTVSFEFRKSGLELEFENERLAYAGFVFIPEENIPEWPEGIPAKVTVTGMAPELTSLSGSTLFADVKRALGTPNDEDIDEFETILTYETGTCILEFEFTPENRLKRFNIFPE